MRLEVHHGILVPAAGAIDLQRLRAERCTGWAERERSIRCPPAIKAAFKIAYHSGCGRGRSLIVYLDIVDVKLRYRCAIQVRDYHQLEPRDVIVRSGNR